MKLPRRPMPIRMKDKGFYDEHSQTQRAIINMTLPFAQKALSMAVLPVAPGPFVIVDYGCSEGKNSLYMVNTAVESIRRRVESQTFNVIFNDLPQNNFNQLLQNLYGSTEGKRLIGGAENNGSRPSVLVYISGRPFHLQVTDDQSVHFGYSSSAAHWLTELPARAIRGHIYLAGADEKEKSNLSKIAAQDWQDFLNCRAAELASGGKLIVTMGARLTDDEQVPYIKGLSELEVEHFSSTNGPSETYTTQIIMDLINELIQGLVEDKKLSQAQADSLCCPIYPRNLIEVKAPLEKAPLKEKFIVEHAEIVRVECPLFREYLRTGDKQTYAKSASEIFRAFMEPVLLAQLFGVNERRRSERLELDGQKIIDELFDRLRVCIQSNPEYFTFFPIHSLLVLIRK